MHLINLQLKNKCLIIEFNHLSTHTKAISRCIQKTNILPITEGLDKRLEAKLIGSELTFCIGAPDCNNTGGTLIISSINGEDIQNIDQLRNALYDWLNT
ncbi:MAG: hypothetical protein ACRCYO_13345 [Bacteroidia bacterium]